MNAKSFIVISIYCIQIFLYPSLNAKTVSSGFGSVILSPSTITQPGNYQLANTIDGNIIIDADNVFLDLNNKKIINATAGISITNHTDITICNGIIEGSTAGVEITDCLQVKIHDIDFIENSTGLLILTASGIDVDNCTFRAHSGQVMDLDSVNNAQISNSQIYFNEITEVIVCNNCTSIDFMNLDVNNNSHPSPDGTLAIFYLPALNSDISFIKNRINNNNAGIISGCINIEGDSNKIICNECVITDNSTTIQRFRGIRLAPSANNGKDCIFRNCIINDNTAFNSCVGILIEDTSENALIGSCIINNNDSTTGICAAINAGGTNTCIRNCSIKGNEASAGDAIGIIATGTHMLIEENIIKDNIGSSSSNGILDLSSPFNDIILSNQVQGHGASNYVLPGGILVPIATLSFASPGPLFTLNTADTLSKYHNISVP